MREFLDNVKYKVEDTAYVIRMWFDRVSDRVKFLALSFLFTPWLALCALLFWQTYDYQAETITLNAADNFDTFEDIIERAEKLERGGSHAEAFELIITHRNNFAQLYTDKQVSSFNAKLSRLITYAEDADVRLLYVTEDLDELYEIQHYKGVVVEVNKDPLYGDTHLVSEDGERRLEQLEVTGLEDAEVGDVVDFYGVPKFNSAAKPISVNAFESEIEQE